MLLCHLIGLSGRWEFCEVEEEIFFCGDIILPLVVVTREEITSGWLVLLFNDVIVLLVNGVEKGGSFNDGNLCDLTEMSGVT